MNNIKEIVDPCIKELGLSVFEVIYKDKTLTIKLDGDDLSIDNIVKATKIIDPLLDEKGIINESYILDVCSKGVSE